jgi:hypothetical protein
MTRAHIQVQALVCCLGACLIAGCRDSAPPVRKSTVRDSAGVQIVEFTPAPPSASRIRLAETPSLQLGMEGDTAKEFNAIWSVTRLSDGTLVVADDEVRLRAYAPDGRLVRTAGRRGGGPGEYGLILSATRCGGDSILVYDSGQQRVSVLSQSLDYVRGFRASIPPDGGGPHTVVCGPDGAIAMLGWPKYVPMPEGSLVRHRMSVATVTRLGAIRVLDSVPGFEQLFAGQGAGPLMFGRETSIARSGRGIATATGDAHEVVVRDDAGRVVQVIRAVASAPLPVTGADVDAYADALAARRGEDAALMRGRVRRERTARAFPAMGQVRGDAAGRLWLQRYPLPRERDVTWDVISTDGMYLGAVSIPLDFRVMEIGSDFVAGVAIGEAGIEEVRLYSYAVTSDGS